jgi:small GTP-binding protein
MNETIKKYRFKIAVVGDGQVGKTSLIKKFTKGSFKKDYIKTIGAQFSVYDKDINDDTIRLLFWDIAGQQDFNFLRPSFFKNSRAAIIVFSLEDNDLGKESFKNIPNWYNDIKQFCGNIPVVLFANKVDLINERDLNHADIEKVVDKNQFFGYSITSAKTGKGVIEAFNSIIDELYNMHKEISTV